MALTPYHSAMERVLQIYRHHGFFGLFDRMIRVLKGRRCDSEKVIAGFEPLLLRNPTELEQEYQQLSFQPVISVVMPVCDPPLDFLDLAIRSVESQLYPHWELLLIDDGSTKSEVIRHLEASAEKNKKIKVITRSTRGGIADASQDGVTHSSGDYVALLDHDDALFPFSLGEVARALNSTPRPEIIYSDEVKINTSGEVVGVAEKEEWSPLYFRGFMYTGHLAVYARTLLEKISGFRSHTSGSQDYDLMLRASEKAEEVRYIPSKLYQWRIHSGSVADQVSQKSYAFERAREAHEDALKRASLDKKVVVTQGPYPGTYRYRAKKCSSELVLWGYCDEGGQLSEGSFWKDLRSQLNSESPFVMLFHQSVEPPTENEMLFLEGSTWFSEVGAVGILFTNRLHTKVAALGWKRSEGQLSPFLEGESLAYGGPGHKLYVDSEVDAVSVRACIIKREVVNAFSEGLPVTLCCSVNPAIRRVQPPFRESDLLRI